MCLRVPHVPFLLLLWRLVWWGNSSGECRNLFQDEFIRVLPIVVTQVRNQRDQEGLEERWRAMEDQVLGTDTVTKVVSPAQWSSSFVKGRKTKFRPFEKIAGTRAPLALPATVQDIFFLVWGEGMSC